MTGADTAPARPAPRGPGHRLRGLPGSVAVALVVLGVVAVWAALPGFLAPGALDQDLGAAALPAGSPGHVLGTDKLGRDILALTIAGTRSAVVGPVVVAAGSMLVGMAAGISAAWFGSWWDALVSRGVEVLLSLPVTLLVSYAYLRDHDFFSQRPGSYPVYQSELGSSVLFNSQIKPIKNFFSIDKSEQ